jgi:hypothetical protein
MIEIYVKSSLVKTTSGELSFVMTASARDGVRVHANTMDDVWMPYKNIMPVEYLTPEMIEKMSPDDINNLIILFKRMVYSLDKKAVFTYGSLASWTETLL